MFDRVLAEVLERHGAALTPACRADLTAALRAAGVAAPEASTDKLQLLDLAGQTWGDADEEPTEAHSLLPQRYEDLGLLGHGGMGQVRRAFDRVLEREVALKMVKARPSPQQRQRFTTEAVQTAALMHPGIVPVFDYGVLDSGVPYYTMPVIGGHTLGAAIEAVHAASTRGAWGLTPEGMSLRRLVSAFHDACEAVAYAHSRGVVHRDLKPDNVMLGEFGETLVLDWGLAEHKDAEGSGGISGTPAYMAPEQAAGKPPSIASDVYGLGAMLYQVLGGEAPYAGMTRREVLDAVRTRSPAPIERTTALALPWDLVLLCRRCMDRDPARRPESAHTVAREVAGWLDGLKRRDEADALVQSAVDLFDEVDAGRMLAADRQAEASALRREIGPHRPIADKRPLWRLEDEARRLLEHAALDEQRALQHLQSALTRTPDHIDAHRRLAQYYQRLHRAAERGRRPVEAATLEMLLRTHDQGEFGPYLSGQSALSLVTDPPGAVVEVYRYVLQERRMVAESTGQVLRTPITDFSLPIGSYLLRIHAPGRMPVDYPVYLSRDEPWTGAAPGESGPTPVLLPRQGALAPGDRYLPAGWCIVGGDPHLTPSHPRRRLWIDGVIFRAQPVTNADYLDFLHDLVNRGEADRAEAHVPRERGRGDGAPIYGRTGDGRYQLVPDADGDLWAPDWPVIMVNLYNALAYAAWRAESSGLPWRLPGEYEWEKAARGVDGRFFPWGDFADPAWANMRDSRESPGPVSVERYPTDVSPYGVRHLAGNAWTWCLDPYQARPPIEDGERYLIPDLGDLEGGRCGRGGDWYGHAQTSRSARRLRALSGSYRDGSLTFRLCRPLVPSRDG